MLLLSYSIRPLTSRGPTFRILFVGPPLAARHLFFSNNRLYTNERTSYHQAMIYSSSRPQRQTGDLRRGRISMPGARYFITCSAVRPESRLVHPACANVILNVINNMDAADFSLDCATIMPDHMHLLFSLSGKLSLPKVIAKFKSLARNALIALGIQWQANFFEHRLRPDELSNDYARYIFLNPYRAGLLNRREEWPYWILGIDADFDFLGFLEERKYPPSEWIGAPLLALGLTDDSIGHD